MELRQIQYFEAAARHLHFTRAARELFVSQPALSIQIQQLEAELGAVLFDRTTRSMRLTEAGAAFLEFARRILAEVRDVASRIDDLSTSARGCIDVAAQQSITACGALPALLVEFRALHPGVDVVLREESGGTASALLRERSIDLALAQTSGPDGAAPLDQLEHVPLYEEEIVLVVAIDHPLRLTARGWPDLAGEPFIAFNESAGLRAMLANACRGAGFTPRIGYESTALGSIRSLASAGLGVALLPLPSVLVTGPSVAILPVGPALRRTISLLRFADRYQSAASRAFGSLVRARLPDLVPTTATIAGPAGSPGPVG